MKNIEDNAKAFMISVIFIVGILTLFTSFNSPLVSAMEMDNVKSYDINTQTAIISNSFLGIPTSKVAELTLNTPRVYSVMPGPDRLVAEFDVNALEDYTNPFRQMEFIDLNTGKQITKEITYKLKVVSYIEVPNEVQVCNGYHEVKFGDGTTAKISDCKKEIQGTREQEVVSWKELDKSSINAGDQITIGLFTNVGAGDNIEWIPTYFGVKISEWAVWTSGLDNRLVSYYNMSSGLEQISGVYNITNRDGTLSYTTGGALIYKALNITLDQNGQVADGLSTIEMKDENVTLNYWFYQTSYQDTKIMMQKYQNGGGRGFGWLHYWDTGGVFTPLYHCVSADTVTISGIPLNSWVMITMSKNATGTGYYINGTFAASCNNAGYTNAVTDVWTIGTNIPNSGDWVGKIDEMGLWNRSLSQAEITQLYNLGVGMTYTNTFVPDVTLNYPQTNTNKLIMSNVTFNCSATTGSNFSNATFFLWDSSENLVYNPTNIVMGTANSTLFSYLFSTNTLQYHWNCKYTQTDGLNSLAATNRTLSIVSPTLNICNQTNNVTFINFTFKDESSTAKLNGSIAASTWSYWLTSAGSSFNNTFYYYNLSEGDSVAFCVDPPESSITTNFEIKYSSTNYPQRTNILTNQLLTNTTYNYPLYLLSSSDGISSTLVVQSSSSSAIQGATIVVQRQINNVWTTIAQQLTDSFGSATFWVSPNFDLQVTVSKTGYDTKTFIWRPSQLTYTVILSGQASTLTFDSQKEGIIYNLFPQNGILYPGTTTFGMNIIAQKGNLINCKMDLINSTGSILIQNSSSFVSPYGCNSTLVWNFQQDRVFGRFYIDVGSGYITLENDGQWRMLVNETTSSGTLLSFLNTLKNLNHNCYLNNTGDEICENMYGDGGRGEFSMIVLVFLFLALVLAILNFNTGFDSINPGISKILLCVVIFFFCYADFFTIQGSTPWTFFDKWIIWIFSFMFAIRYYLSSAKREV